MTMPRLQTALLVVLLGSCTSTGPAGDVVTVEGRVSVRGNEPFTAVWLETDMRTYYVLVLDAETSASLVTPVRYRATGRVYRDDWNGRPMAHLAVSGLVRLDR